MLILGIEASGRTASVALLSDEVLLSEYTLNVGLTHSQTLLPMVDEVLSRAGKTVDMLDGIAVSVGPGSFTGLRIGAATAKGLALPRGIPLLSVPTLEALSMNVSESEAYVHPIMDARRQQVYTAMFRQGVRIGAEEAVSITELTERLNQEPECPRLFLGDGVPVYRDFLAENLLCPFRFASPQNLLQRASSVALLGARQLRQYDGEQTDAADGADASTEESRGARKPLHLNYVRKPQAEREREAKGLRSFDLRAMEV